MASQSKSVYASAPFKFVVDGEPLYIHTDLVSFHSKPLDRMINGPMAEGQQGFATLEDVDEGTFVRFIEWAHKGSYTAAEFAGVVEENPKIAGLCTNDDQASKSGEIPIPEEIDEPFVDGEIPAEGYNMPEPPAEIEDGWGSWGGGASSSKKSKSKKKTFNTTPPTTREDLRQSFVSRRPVVRKSAIEISPPRRNQSSAEIYSDVFLSHARLYVFAEKYDIQPLKMLALDELHAVLKDFILHVKRTGDIIDLLRYVYANTGESREGVEDMRTLVMQYVGYQMDTMMKNPEFGDLMIKDRGDLTIKERGDLLSDLLKMVAKRISSNVDD